MNIYVASSWKNQAEVKAMMAKLTAAGHLITHDWTREEATPAFLSNQEVRNEYGWRDFQGVLDADAVVVLAHPEARDTRFEMGAAVGMQKPVVVVDPSKWDTVFMDPRMGVHCLQGADEVVPFLAGLEQEWFGGESFDLPILKLEMKS